MVSTGENRKEEMKWRNIVALLTRFGLLSVWKMVFTMHTNFSKWSERKICKIIFLRKKVETIPRNWQKNAVRFFEQTHSKYWNIRLRKRCIKVCTPVFILKNMIADYEVWCFTMNNIDITEMNYFQTMCHTSEKRLRLSVPFFFLPSFLFVSLVVNNKLLLSHREFRFDCDENNFQLHERVCIFFFLFFSF